MMVRRVLLSLVVSAVAFAVYAQIHTVDHVGIVAKPATYTGPCPATITFIATIHVTHHPVRVTYVWERSDGARSQKNSVDITSAGRGVEETWKLGAGHENLHVWEQLHVLAPTGISSPRATAQIHCR